MYLLGRSLSVHIVQECIRVEGVDGRVFLLEPVFVEEFI